MVDLTHLNTLQVSATAKDLLEVNSPTDLPSLHPSHPFLFLGTGANLLFKQDFPGTIVKINLPGINFLKETSQSVFLEVGSGVLWHDLVTFAVSHNWSGLENMALIPGTVGAAVVGNIAAYGQNQETVFVGATAWNLETGQSIKFSKSECGFGYRDSFFKQPEFKNYLLTSVTYELSKTAHLELSYTATRHASLLPTIQKLKSANSDTSPITIQNVFAAVVTLRTEKLPDWRLTPNAGSFFKNPLVTHEKLNALQSEIPDLQAYPADQLMYVTPDEKAKFVKIPIGRVLDHLGWRGKRLGRVATSPSHALVIVNADHASGQEIFAFAESMRNDVKTHFDIDLTYEVVVV